MFLFNVCHVHALILLVNAHNTNELTKSRADTSLINYHTQLNQQLYVQLHQQLNVQLSVQLIQQLNWQLIDN